MLRVMPSDNGGSGPAASELIFVHRVPAILVGWRWWRRQPPGGWRWTVKFVNSWIISPQKN